MANLAEGQRLLFFIPQTIWWPPPGAPAGPEETNRIIELESACVDIAFGSGLLKVSGYLVWDRGAIMQTCGFIWIWSLLMVSGWMFKFKDLHRVEKCGPCVSPWLQIILHHPFMSRSSSFKLNTCSRELTLVLLGLERTEFRSNQSSPSSL